MCAWALLCSGLAKLLPPNPPTIMLAPFMVFMLLGFAWVVPAATVGLRTAGYFLKLTIGIWAGTGLLAGLLVLALR